MPYTQQEMIDLIVDELGLNPARNWTVQELLIRLFRVGFFTREYQAEYFTERLVGEGGPDGSVSANALTLYLDSSTNALYVNTNGGTSWSLVGGGAGGGVTDHGALTGLEDDDHTQYHNNARGDARYYTQTAADTLLSGKANSAHTHDIGDINATGAPGVTTYLRGDGTWSIPPTDGSAVAPFVTVGSSTLPPAELANCTFQCTGTNDQLIINEAIRSASRVADLFTGAKGLIGVYLIGDTFAIGHSATGEGAGAIDMLPGVHLRGQGPGTLIEPHWATDVDRGAIELANTAVDHCRVSDLAIGLPGYTEANGHGIKFTQSGDGQTYSVKTGNDPFILIDNVILLSLSRWGVYLDGANSGARETHLYGVHCFGPDLGGFYIGSTDCKFVNCTANAGSGPGFYTLSGSSGNTKLVNCKSYYCNSHGFHLNGARSELVGCTAQDNGEWGFYLNSADITLSACVADSNNRLATSSGGFRLGGSGMYEGLHAFDRGQTPGSPQLIGINFPFTGSQVYCTGRVTVPSGSSHVTGTPAANSYVRVVRHGTTLHSVG